MQKLKVVPCGEETSEGVSVWWKYISEVARNLSFSTAISLQIRNFPHRSDATPPNPYKASDICPPPVGV